MRNLLILHFIFTWINVFQTHLSDAADLDSFEYLRSSILRDYPNGGIQSDEFQSVYNACARSMKWGSSPIPNEHLKPYRYIHENPQLCNGQTDLLIAVHSHPAYSQRRHAIRSTWGSLKTVKNIRITVAFFFGSNVSKEHQEMVDKESQRFADVVQLDFSESYRNLTLKHLSVYQWMLQHCSQVPYFLKVDDDTFVDIMHLALYLPEYPSEGFVCRTYTVSIVYRKKNNKWHVTETEYPDSFYPSHCEGFAYLLNPRKIRDIYWCSTFTKYFWIDDVYVSGIVADRLGIKRDKLSNGHSYGELVPSYVGDEMMDCMFLRHGSTPFFHETATKVWSGVLKRHTSF